MDMSYGSQKVFDNDLVVIRASIVTLKKLICVNILICLEKKQHFLNDPFQSYYDLFQFN